MNVHMLSANIVTAMSQCDEDELDRMEILNYDMPTIKLISVFEHDDQIYFRTNQNEVISELLTIISEYEAILGNNQSNRPKCKRCKKRSKNNKK